MFREVMEVTTPPHHSSLSGVGGPTKLSTVLETVYLDLRTVLVWGPTISDASLHVVWTSCTVHSASYKFI